MIWEFMLYDNFVHAHYIGKIAASSGHASWISSKRSRTRVFELRGRSDAVIVGGNTVRRDSTSLTWMLIFHGLDTSTSHIVF